jgi:hypothetical protein
VQGVLEIFQRAPLVQEPEWSDLLLTLAGQVAIAIDNATLYTDLQQSNTELVPAYDTTIEGWSRALDIPYCHHEKWDGTGYPRGPAGEQIPRAARIFAVIDVVDALLSDRPYRPAWSAERVRDHIAPLSGSHFDPAVVAGFLKQRVPEAQ